MFSKCWMIFVKEPNYRMLTSLAYCRTRDIVLDVYVTCQSRQILLTEHAGWYQICWVTSSLKFQLCRLAWKNISRQGRRVERQTPVFHHVALMSLEMRKLRGNGQTALSLESSWSSGSSSHDRFKAKETTASTSRPKLTDPRTGPFEITKVHNNGTVEIQKGPSVTKLVNIRRLTPYFESTEPLGSGWPMLVLATGDVL